jgi:hypothetical protein
MTSRVHRRLIGVNTVSSPRATNITSKPSLFRYGMSVDNSILRRLCGLVVRVPGYRSESPGSIPGTTRKKVVGLERSPLSLVSTTEELHDRKVAAPV